MLRESKVLISEEDDAALGYCFALVFVFWREERRGILVIARSLSRLSALGALMRELNCAPGNSRPITGVTSKLWYASRVPAYWSGCLTKEDFEAGLAAGAVVMVEGAMAGGMFGCCNDTPAWRVVRDIYPISCR